jgi:hypothetical protein
MRPLTLDPTAGKRARAMRERPGVPAPIPDPTDPRWGSVRSYAGEDSRPLRIVDPTHPKCGEPLA